MERREQKLLFFSLCFFLSSLLIGKQCVEGRSNDSQGYRRRQVQSHAMNGYNPKKLFVFGDSYADTGNNNKSMAPSWSWKAPYGITYPGRPAGRYSNGRLLTDFLAKSVGLKSPIPYVQRASAPSQLQYGMNFAYGGSGVFQTLFSYPNMTAQIDFLQQLINDKVYNKSDLQSSLALVSLAGNDYATYAVRNGSTEYIASFIANVVKQLAVNLKRIHDMGVKRIAVTALQPVGCLPQATIANSFNQCNDTLNIVPTIHNLALVDAVAKLNNETKNSSSFVILDLYGSFSSVLQNKGNVKFETPLQPCCKGICGSVDRRGAKMYTVCANPENAFFWDLAHPTQAGWGAVFLALKPILQKFNN